MTVNIHPHASSWQSQFSIGRLGGDATASTKSRLTLLPMYVASVYWEAALKSWTALKQGRQAVTTIVAEVCLKKERADPIPTMY